VAGAAEAVLHHHGAAVEARHAVGICDDNKRLAIIVLAVHAALQRDGHTRHGPVGMGGGTRQYRRSGVD